MAQTARKQETSVARPPLAEPATRRDRRGETLRRLLVAADMLALCFAWGVAFLYTALGPGSQSHPLDVLALLIAGGPVWVAFCYAHGLYHVDSRRAHHGTAEEAGPVLHMITLWTWLVMLLFEVTGLAQVDLARFAVFWVTAFVAIISFRAMLRIWARRRHWYQQNTLVLGSGAEVRRILDRIARHPEYGINIVASADYSEANSLRYVGHIAEVRGDIDLMEMIDEYRVDRVIMAWSARYAEEHGGRFDLVRRLSYANVHVDLSPQWGEVVGAKLELNEMEGMPLLSVPYARLSRSSLFLKRCMDVAVSSAALLVLAPLFIGCALAIRLDSPGPVFFRQRRVGRNARRFDVLKFRSMRADADSRKSEVAALNIHRESDPRMFKIKDDPRVTRFGGWLRRTSLDELPQLINILRGDMSLVGPRPLIEPEDDQVEGRFRQRLALTPGLTGLWQVHGRSEIPFEQMVNLDYLYVTSWSLWHDFQILAKTFPAVFRSRGAY